MSRAQKPSAAALKRLCEIEGKTEEQLLSDAVTDSVCPGICILEECDYTCDVEPDQDAGYCDECGNNTVKSALILAGLI